MSTVDAEKLKEIALRIREMREIFGYSEAQMAEKAEVTLAEYRDYENGKLDFPFTFIHKCALAFNVGITDILEGESANLVSYTVTRKGQGQETAKEEGINIQNLAPLFKKKISEPYYVKYSYSPELQNRPIHTTKHSGQEFDYIVKGSLKVQVGENIEILEEGDSIYYNSSTPHGMIAVNGKDCEFIAVVLPGENVTEQVVRDTIVSVVPKKKQYIADKYVKTETDESGVLTKAEFFNTDKFNFAFDVVDAIADKDPEKLAMIHLSKDMTERRFTFMDFKKESNRVANYFKSLGIKKGDRVMLVLKRHYQFWFSILALHKLGAIAIPATCQLQEHDFEYRFNSAGVKAIICTGDGNTAAQVDAAQGSSPTLQIKVIANGAREGWRSFDEEYPIFSTHFDRTKDTACGSDKMIMLFTSGTSGYPKIAVHSYKYGLAHYITAKFWHGADENGLHFTISETGWGKSLWGKLYGQWLSECAIFVYDFDRFDANEILPLFAKYHITTFCAPPTMLRMMIKLDISKYDLSSIKHMTTAGEALNPEVYRQFKQATGLRIHEGFGQTETILSIGNLLGCKRKIGSMGKPVPIYDIDLLDSDGNKVKSGEVGEICIRTDGEKPMGLFDGYYNDPERTLEVWHDGYYHTGDTAWRDEDGFFWYVGRADDVIKSSGYRIGPFEIESVIMELPYVLECGVSPAPDEIRGQVVKASIVLVKGTEPTEELKKEIQNYVKTHTAPYKYPRIVVFRDDLPKTISGKIIRSLL